MDSLILSHTSYIAISISLLLLTKLILSIITTTTKNKKGPPSPPSFPILGHLHLIKKPLHHSLARLSSLHGPILLLRFGPRPVLSVSSLPLAEQCFITNDVAFANRVNFPSAKLRTYNFSTIASASYGPHWRNVRRIATDHFLSPHRLTSYTAVRAAEVRALVATLFKESNTIATFAKVELKSRLSEFALNSVMSAVAGTRYRRESAASMRFREAVEAQSATSRSSGLASFLPWMRWFDFDAEKRREMMVSFAEYSDDYLQGLIDEIRRMGGKINEGEKTLIGDLLSDPENYTDRIIKVIISSMLAGGTHTVSNTIEWTMALLLNNPNKLKKAQAEINEHLHNDNQLLQESDIPNLAYLECIITESLRLYPAGPLLVPHKSSEDCEVGGYFIPHETMLLVNAYAIHRDPDAWDEPEKFMPERFENGKDDERKLLLFGMGRRRCPGEKLARRVVGLVIGTLIQCFDWERVGEELVDMSEGSEFTLARAVPLEAMYRPRENMKGILSAS